MTRSVSFHLHRLVASSKGIDDVGMNSNSAELVQDKRYIPLCLVVLPILSIPEKDSKTVTLLYRRLHGSQRYICAPPTIRTSPQCT
jgi:hypothetical protein